MLTFEKIGSVSFLLFSLIMTLPLFADEPENTVYLNFGDELGLIENSTLTILDDVDDNCWTNGSTIRSKTHLLFEQNDIYVPDFQPAFFGFRTVSATISAYGSRTTDGLCIVSASFAVKTSTYPTIGGNRGSVEFNFSTTATLSSNDVLLWSGRNVNDQIADFYDGEASKFLAKAIAARRRETVVKFNAAYPTNGKPPMSQKEWENLTAKTNATAKQ